MYRHFFIAALCLLCLIPLSAWASADALPEEDQLCLMCHTQEQSLTFKDGEKLSVTVNLLELKQSVHRIIGCSACHDITPEKHPHRSFASKRDYRIASAAICTRCHTSYKTGIHAKLMAKAPRDTVCTDCHGSHSVRRAREMAQGNHYCLTCHGIESQMEFKNGERTSIKMNEALLNQSIHKDLSCTDCHFGFSSEEHPVRVFASKRDYSISLSESCRRCHFDKYTKTMESIHFNTLIKGNLKAPVCTDCHGSHSVASGRKERVSNARKCSQCHEEIYRTYERSVHGGALISEQNGDVPICSDCHKAHDIHDPRTVNFHNEVPNLCGKCHANKKVMSKYGLSTAVVDTYLQDFHGITLKLYQKGGNSKPIAVCTDCHGIHDITKTDAPGTNLIKANLLNRCRKCHPDATANFPDSWISHYQPSLKKAPLVYLVNVAYQLFIPFMVIGLILQILLHIWRYAINK
ncbi:MAG: cytochrome c3 family protein [Alphaproteobacteria bacterium]|uniref:Cytochrome c3 family protein n=1 Tax=Candidatus Nitrobium versatile TaxID=2884831 RepID=A0A953SDF4_9BACT|nr:cytochrome c3 family protein [Candidatus Nitrobium versatile]